MTKAIILGAGYRGRAYAAYRDAHPGELQIVGVADPKQATTIKAIQYWNDWRQVLEAMPQADLIVIALPDALHYEAGKAFLSAGYHVLLEKPLANTYARTEELVKLAISKKRLLMVAHELRYSAYFSHIKALIDSGDLGEIVSIAQQESVNFRKFAHSFVRGSLASAKASSPIIISKCSHDLDLIAWWMGEKCKRVNSLGSIKLFRQELAPQGASERCIDCPHKTQCLWSASKMYLENQELSYMFADQSPEAMAQVVKSSQYGQCVFKANNDVPDHQTVNMEFLSGATASLVMSAFTEHNIRTTRISLTQGEIVGNGEEIRAVSFKDGKVLTISADKLRSNNSRHDGGDFGLVAQTLALVRRNDENELKTASMEALESHLIGFAAESSRLDGGRTVLL